MTARDVTAALTGLTEHASSAATGCLHIHDRARTHAAQAYFTDGKVYAVHVEGFRPALADRMLTAGLLDQVLHDQVIAAAGGDPRNADIGHLAVRRGMVAQETLDAIHREILLSSIAAIASWPDLRYRFRKGVTTTDYTVPAVPVTAILSAVTRRAQHWATIWSEMAPGCPPPEATPRRTDQAPVLMDLSPDARALLTRIDGVQSVDDLAGACGLTRFETSHLLHTLVTAGLVTVTPDERPWYTVPAPSVAEEPAPMAFVAAAAPEPVAPPVAPATPAVAPALVAPVAPAVFRPAPEEATPVTAPSAPFAQPQAPTGTTSTVQPDADLAAPAAADSTDPVAEARTRYAAAEENLANAERRASETYADHSRISAVVADAQHAANQAEQSVQAAIAEEHRAHENLARAQAALDKATELTNASRRAAAELRDRAAAVAADADRARERAHTAAASATDAATHLDRVRADLAHAQHQARSAD